LRALLQFYPFFFPNRFSNLNPCFEVFCWTLWVINSFFVAERLEWGMRVPPKHFEIQKLIGNCLTNLFKKKVLIKISTKSSKKWLLYLKIFWIKKFGYLQQEIWFRKKIKLDSISFGYPSRKTVRKNLKAQQHSLMLNELLLVRV